GRGKKLSIGEKVKLKGKKKTMRFIDIRVVKGKDVVNIETKRGKSSYKKQKARDQWLEGKGRGPTLVVRNCAKNSKHRDCRDLKSGELTLLGEILNEFETPGRPILRYGSTGANVVYLQKRLNYHNSSIIPLKEDGIWGP